MKFNLCLLLFMFSFLKASIAHIDCFTGVGEVKAHQAEALLKQIKKKYYEKHIANFISKYNTKFGYCL